MDPQSAAFTPRDDIWRWQSEMTRVQQVQADHSERLLRLERRQEDDARMKSVWGASSPFPVILGGTPQQAPLSQPPTDAFADFDEEQTNLIGSLHLDADDEPRRMGIASRANSVRFDESANPGHWSHASRTSVDLPTRTGSGLSNPILERTFQHKFDGRNSSTAHSVQSLASGRANSLGLETTFSAAHSNHSPSGELPGLVPGLFVLGSVPSIIRCWLTTKFKHDSLLYAAICTGSHTSFIGSTLVQELGFASRVATEEDGTRKIKIDVYLPEAVTRPLSSRSGSPNPQVPCINVEFTLQDTSTAKQDSKAVQIFIGSDVLRAHNADVLFSSNSISMFDDERTRLSVPLVRPEDERAFNTLCTVSRDMSDRNGTEVDRPGKATFEPFMGLGAKSANESVKSDSDRRASIETVDDERSSALNANNEEIHSASEAKAVSTRLESTFAKTVPPSSEIAGEVKPRSAADAFQSSSRSGPSPVTLSNWRRDPSTEARNPTLDWANASRAASSGSSSTYQRRDQGIKVLKPIRSASRAASSSQISAGTSSPASGSQPQSRFFESGTRRSSNVGVDPNSESGQQHLQRSTSNDPKTIVSSTVPLTKSRTNPLGGASAFAWMKTGSGTAGGDNTK